MKKVLLIERNESVADSRADLLRDYGCDVTVSAGDVLPGQFDSVLYVMGDLNGRTGDCIGEIRRVHPRSKLVIYSTSLAFEIYAQQIKSAHAETLEVIKTPAQIAAVL
ncbi:MAG: hypothetical protein AABX14_01395 [Candidatus Aenigmatarchaeota archaeon]